MKIERVEDLQIIKIKDWSISFKHDNNYYLLHVSSEGYETGATLYQRKVVDGKIIGLIDIASCYSSDNIYESFLKRKDQGKTFKLIDKDYLIRRMTIKKLCTSYMDMDKYNKWWKKKTEDIRFYEDKAREVKKERNKFIGLIQG